MDDQPLETESDRFPPRAGITIGLVITSLLLSAMIYQGYQAWIAFQRDDTNHLETPLALATARQLADGPSTLYGPFSGSHPEVLIHAPLYYRLVAVMAWTVTRFQVGAVDASLYSGRFLSAVGLALILFASWRIARLDMAARWVGVLAALLVAASPVFGSFGFTVRPDTLGIALQTLGFWSAWKVLSGTTTRPIRTAALCGILYGLAACVKQHLIVAAGITVLLMIIAVVQGRVSRGALVSMVLAGLAVVVGVYGAEEVVTHGWMSRSVFVLPARLRELAPAPRGHVLFVFTEVAKRGIGEILLAVAVVIAGGRRALVGTRLDAALWLVMIAEVLAMVPLCMASEGAFVNYAMPAVVWGSILLARALGRVFEAKTSLLKRGFVVVASVLLLLRGTQLVVIAETDRRDDRQVLAALFADPDVASHPRSSLYFVSKPQHNRLYGATDLGLDEWLYQSFEMAEMAEPRSEWLKRRISGPDATIDLVIVPSNDEGTGGAVPGIAQPLPDLGYRHVQQYGQYGVWIRER